MSKSMNKKGFTLIELAVASMLLAVVGLAIVSTFTGGLKVYYRLRDNVSARTEILMSAFRPLLAFSPIPCIVNTDLY